MTIEALSKAERRVMELLANGFSQREVADKLRRSPNTIATHVTRVRIKLKARSPVHAVLIVHRHLIEQELATRYA